MRFSDLRSKKGNDWNKGGTVHPLFTTADLFFWLPWYLSISMHWGGFQSSGQDESQHLEATVLYWEMADCSIRVWD